MICENFHVTQNSKFEKRTVAGDRIFVAKFLKPRRWDLVVFRFPEKPAEIYVKRLVGLPGETVHIEEGAIWIDGKKQNPPDSIRGNQYLSQIPDWYGPDPWGSPARPAKLGSDEYFVLGDFSAQSYDSRFWQQGAPGHPSFAVPQSHMKGVVTHTYWPVRRWRIHR